MEWRYCSMNRLYDGMQEESTIRRTKIGISTQEFEEKKCMKHEGTGTCYPGSFFLSTCFTMTETRSSSLMGLQR